MRSNPYSRGSRAGDGVIDPVVVISTLFAFAGGGIAGMIAVLSPHSLVILFVAMAVGYSVGIVLGGIFIAALTHVIERRRQNGKLTRHERELLKEIGDGISQCDPEYAATLIAKSKRRAQWQRCLASIFANLSMMAGLPSHNDQEDKDE